MYWLLLNSLLKYRFSLTAAQAQAENNTFHSWFQTSFGQIQTPSPISLFIYQLYFVIKSDSHNNQNKQNQMQVQRQIQRIEKRIFEHTGLSQLYQINHIKISHQVHQVIKTTFIKSEKLTTKTFYLGHGFQGTSLMYFPYFHFLLERGNIVLWQIRGMGLTTKIQYPSIQQNQTEQFYMKGIQYILDYYQHKNIIFISHSFSGYITMRFLIKYGKKYNIQKCLLLSPIGVTPKDEDHKNKINTVSDFFHSLKSGLAWTFHVTKRSFLKHLTLSLKNKYLKSTFLEYELQSIQIDLLTDLFSVLLSIPGGSQKYFYQLIEPRVLPKTNQSISELIEINSQSIDFQITFLYGGTKDWVDKQGAEGLSKRLQRCSIKILENCDHLLPLYKNSLKNGLRDLL